MRALAMVVLLTAGACSAEDNELQGEEPFAPADVTWAGCPPGYLTLESGDCAPPGAPEGCELGEREVEGTCQPIGVPLCAEGFATDGERGCAPVLPAQPCGDGMMALPGETRCREVAPCGSGPWGGIPVESDTVYADGGYLAPDADGSAGKPWPTIQQAVNDAADGAIVAVAAGVYPEDVTISGKAVRLWGRCPAMVEITGANIQAATLFILNGADGTEVHQLAVSGGSIGSVAATNALDVVYDTLWVHDGERISAEDVFGPAGATLRGSLIERTRNIGVLVGGAHMVIEDSVVRDVASSPQGTPTASILVEETATGGIPDAVLDRVVIERSMGTDVGVVGGSATAARLAILRDGGYAEPLPAGVLAYEGRSATSVHVVDSSIYDVPGVAVGAVSAALELERSTVRGAFMVDDARGHVVMVLGGTPALVRDSVLSDAAADGVYAESDVVLENTAVLRSGYVGVYAIRVEGATEPDALEVREVLIDGAQDGGIASLGVALSMDDTHVRGVSLGMYGRCVEVNSGLLASALEAHVTRARLEDCAEYGLFAGGVALSVSELSVRRAGLMCFVASKSETAVSSTVDAKRLLFEDCAQSGLALDGGALTGAGIAIDRIPGSDAFFGRGVNVQSQSGNVANASLRDMLVEGVRGVGVLVMSSALDLQHTQLVGATAWNDILGMGLYAWGDEVGRSVVSLDEVWAVDGMGAGVANRSSDVAIGDSLVDCHAPALVGDSGEAGDYTFADQGHNVCGCRQEVTVCKVLGAALEAPDPIRASKMTIERKPLGGPLPYAHYDRRKYRTVSIEEGYAMWAGAYGDFVDRFDIDLFERSALLTSRVPGARVVDLACGNGRIGRWLKALGATSVVGVDRSPEMLARAVERGVYERTLVADITTTGLPEASFDGAITSMALCHVSDLHAFFREAGRLLRPGGWLAVLDFHPLFLFMGIPTHFDPVGGDGPIAIENHVHPMSRFFNAARETGFVLRELEERFVDADWVAAMPSYERYLGFPITHFWAFER